MISIAEETTTTSPAQATEGQPKATKKARVTPQGARVATKKGKSAKKPTPAKKAPKGAKKATSAREGARPKSCWSVFLTVLSETSNRVAISLLAKP
jgi:hypothetical protein